ncbi:ankyrin repeat domain-containing protein [Flavobacterium sp. Sd200]|uniref:ankyrin repeat domain-containing protein n=1 Tax=Flavobacterium sp. Sd200 TaxID=2692211 RepID=UPI0013695EEA|nr:ankyrin repeat domain-containing protein [Flavobacterium sp. Sd200]MXN90679.1 ankyrin repeat domain-containing protein [Flavobacterium sp. Sd200]
MKKSIIYSALTLVAFCNITTASPIKVSSVDSSITVPYSRVEKATPLALAIAKGDVTAVKKFIGYGSNVHEKSNDMTPLMIAARYNEVEIIKVLLENGANINDKNSKGYNALKYAQISNANEAAALLSQQSNK